MKGIDPNGTSPEDRLAAIRPQVRPARDDDALAEACHTAADLDLETLFAYCEGALPPDVQAWVEHQAACNQFSLDQLALAAELTADSAADPHQPADRLTWAERCKTPHALPAELLQGPSAPPAEPRPNEVPAASRPAADRSAPRRVAEQNPDA